MTGTQAVAQRMVNAEDAFIGMLQEMHSIGKADALKVLNVYRRLNLVKTDAVIGRIYVNHGRYLDRDAVIAALETG